MEELQANILEITKKKLDQIYMDDIQNFRINL